MNIDNDHTGVSERHPYRKIFNDRIDLTFYVDATNYLPIQYFERWMQYIAGEDINSSGQNDPNGKTFTIDLDILMNTCVKGFKSQK